VAPDQGFIVNGRFSKDFHLTLRGRGAGILKSIQKAGLVLGRLGVTSALVEPEPAGQVCLKKMYSYAGKIFWSNFWDKSPDELIINKLPEQDRE